MTVAIIESELTMILDHETIIHCTWKTFNFNLILKYNMYIMYWLTQTYFPGLTHKCNFS